MNRGSKRSSMRRSTRYVTSSSAALALLIVVVGCWSSPPSSPPGAPTKPPPEQPGERAERALRGDAPFDLRFPEQTPPRRDVATEAVLAACRAAHHPSCWLLLQVATSQSALNVGFADAVSRCQEGDLWSCQAIPQLAADPLLPAGLPGEQGRSLSGKGRAPTDEEAAKLRAECGDGFAYSCKVLADRSSDVAERREMHDKMSLAARAGCRRKVPDACLLVGPDWPTEDRLAALDWNCQVRRYQCDRYGAALFALGRRDDARTEYERACQYGRSPGPCLELAELYRDGSLTEPVKDRGRTIAQVACASAKNDGDVDIYEECAASP
jgi:hypothetical protein